MSRSKTRTALALAIVIALTAAAPAAVSAQSTPTIIISAVDYIIEGTSTVVFINPSARPSGAGTMTIAFSFDDPDRLTVTPAEITLTATYSRWFGWRWPLVSAILVRAEENDTVEGFVEAELTAAVTATTLSGADYDGVVSTKLISVIDNDHGVLVTPTSLAVGEGQTGSYGVSLSTPPWLISIPDREVVVELSVDDPSVTLNPSQLVFTGGVLMGNWRWWQTVEVTVADDDEYTGARTATISHTIVYADEATHSIWYPEGMAGPQVTLDIADDEEAPLPPPPPPVVFRNPPMMRGGAWLIDMFGHWGHEDGSAVVSLGLMEAPGGFFNPDGKVTRGEFAEMLAKALGYRRTGELPFLAAMTGDLKPAITREEAAVLVGKALVFLGQRGGIDPFTAKRILSSFTDVDEVSRDALEWVALAYYCEMIKGRTRELLAPRAELLRSEAARMMVRLWYWSLKRL